MRYLIFFLFTMNLQAFPMIPDIDRAKTSICTKEDPDFDEFRYLEKIAHCKRRVSKRTKNEICDSYGVFNRTGYTVDHIIPLSIGGTNHKNNLWCQNKLILSSDYEYQLYSKLKRGKIKQVEAIRDILIYKFSIRPY